MTDWKQALDREGFFFQKKVQALVEGILGSVAEDEIPARAGPKESPEETLIDFRATIDAENSPRFELVFECKKTFDKEWLFLRTNRDKDKFQSVSLRQVIEPAEAAGDDVRSFLAFEAGPLKLGVAQTHEICEYGFEAKRPKNEADTSPILRAAKQVAIGVHQSLREALDTSVSITELMRGSKMTRIAVLPIIVTNAPLLVGRYDAEQVDLDSGNIDANAFSFDTRGWLVYRYHSLRDLVFTEFAEMRVGTDWMDTEEEGVRFYTSLLRKASRIDMFVVRASSLGEFLQKLTTCTTRENGRPA